MISSGSPALSVLPMKHRRRLPEQDDLLRPRLVDLIDPRHELVKLQARGGRHHRDGEGHRPSHGCPALRAGAGATGGAGARRRGERLVEETGILPVEIAAAPTVSSAPTTTAAVEIVLANGRRLRGIDGLSASGLAQLIRVLESA